MSEGTEEDMVSEGTEEDTMTGELGDRGEIGE